MGRLARLRSYPVRRDAWPLGDWFLRSARGNMSATATMPLRIRVSDPARAADLLAFLRGIGADASRDGETIIVTRRHAPVAGEPPHQDRVELEFIVRTWANMRPETEFEIDEAA